MLSWLKKIFLNEKIVLGVIVLNAIIIYLQESGLTHPALYGLDIACTLFFTIEMVWKQCVYGLKNYWKDGWNRMDGILVIISFPSLIEPFINIELFNFSFLLTLRLLRVLRFLRLLHFFPNIVELAAGLKRALKQSGAVVMGFLVLIIIFGLINCSLYKEVAPEYFGTPLNAIYTVFRIITIEGWYEIPDTIAANTNSVFIGELSRFYFCLLLCGGGILGLSFINSVFVDAMVEDNNDDMKYQLTSIEQKLDDLSKRLDEKEK